MAKFDGQNFINLTDDDSKLQLTVVFKIIVRKFRRRWRKTFLKTVRTGNQSLGYFQQRYGPGRIEFSCWNEFYNRRDKKRR